MAEPAAPPTDQELIDLANSISQQISDSLGRQTQTLASTLTAVRESIGEVELILMRVDEAINDLLNRRVTSTEEKRQLEEKIREMEQSRIAIKEALMNMKRTYDDGVASLQQASDEYPGLVDRMNATVKDRASNLLAKINDALNQQPPANPPEGQQGGRRRRHASRKSHRRDKTHRRAKSHRRLTGGYKWARRSSSKRNN